MAQFDCRNLAPTLYAIPRRRLPCAVGFAIDPWANGGRTWTWSHQWLTTGSKRPDATTQRLARCLNCRKTVREILDPPIWPRAPKRPPDHASDGWLRAAIESGR